MSTKAYKILISVVVVISIPLAVIEWRTSPQMRLFAKTVSQCGFPANPYIEVTGKYWELRGVDASKVNTKDAIEALTGVNTAFGEECWSATSAELNILRSAGFDFSSYRDDKGRPLLVSAVLLQEQNLVEWLLDHGGFMNYTIKTPGPYEGKNIFYVARSLSENLKTRKSQEILTLISRYEL